ncbi:ABC transporter substrate-binding protein [Chloroflexota bacterium]
MKKTGYLWLFLIVAVSILILPFAGCTSSQPQTVTVENTATKTVTATATITDTVEVLKIIDGLGREVNITGIPSKIVSIAPSNTEILFALGLGEKVYGVTDNCDYPQQANEKEKVGGFTEIDIEKIITMNPDLILAEDMHKYEVIPALERHGFTVVTLVPHNLQEVMDSIELIGSITGTQDEAVQVVADMQKRIEAITDITDGLTEVEKTKVLYILWHEPIMSVGSDTRIHELIEKAGGINIAAVAGEGYPTLQLEEIININPGVIIVDSDASLQFILNESRLSEVDAITNNRVYSIDPDITNRPTPRIVEALEIMAELLQPALFPATE